MWYTDCEEPVRSGPKHVRLDLSNTGDHVVLLVLKCNIADEVSQHGGVPRYVLNGCEEVMLHPHKQAPLFPRVLKIQRLEVVSKAPLSGTDHSNEAEVAQLFILVQRSILALEDNRHVQLLDYKVNHLSC